MIVAKLASFAFQDQYLRQLVEHSCRDSSGVCSKQVLLCLLNLPVVAISLRTIAAGAVNFLYLKNKTIKNVTKSQTHFFM
jgi:hypothetical protein